MAKHPQGLFGPFIGRIGNVVGYMLDGVNITRTIGSMHGPRTAKQYANETKMGLISSLSSVIEEFLNFGLRSVSGPSKQAPRNHFITLNKQSAVKGEYPTLETDFSKLIVADGTIPAPKNAVVTVIDNGLNVVWDTDLEAEGTNDRDQVMLLAYFPAIKKAVILPSGARRTIGKEYLKLPDFEIETVVETYMAFISDDRNNASPSVYMGKMILNKGANDLEEGFKYESQRVDVETGEISEEKIFGYIGDPQPYSETDPDQPLKMKLLSPVLSTYLHEINLGFPGGGVETPFNQAISYNIMEAINGYAPLYRLQFNKMKFSKGKRETAWCPKIAHKKGKTLQVQWQVPQTANMKLIGNDEACFMAYNETSKENAYAYGELTRKELSGTLKLNYAVPGDTIHVWMFFRSADGMQVSNTDYCGFITIPK